MWRKVAKTKDFEEGKGVLVPVDGRQIALFLEKGEFFAIENQCPHRGGPLVEGRFEGDELVCPWHAWGFDVKSGKCKTVPGMDVDTFPVKVEGEDVYLDA